MVMLRLCLNSNRDTALLTSLNRVLLFILFIYLLSPGTWCEKFIPPADLSGASEGSLEGDYQVEISGWNASCASCCSDAHSPGWSLRQLWLRRASQRRLILVLQKGTPAFEMIRAQFYKQFSGCLSVHIHSFPYLHFQFRLQGKQHVDIISLLRFSESFSGKYI